MKDESSSSDIMNTSNNIIQITESIQIPWNVLYVVAISIRLITANKAPITDCDEVFNYWEPLHYMLYGS